MKFRCHPECQGWTGLGGQPWAPSPHGKNLSSLNHPHSAACRAQAPVYLTPSSHGPGRGRTGVRDVETEAYRVKGLPQVTGFLSPLPPHSCTRVTSAFVQHPPRDILCANTHTCVYISELSLSPHILYTVLYFTDMLCLEDCPIPGHKGRPQRAEQPVYLNNNLFNLRSQWAGR